MPAGMVNHALDGALKRELVGDPGKRDRRESDDLGLRLWILDLQ